MEKDTYSLIDRAAEIAFATVVVIAVAGLLGVFAGAVFIALETFFG